MTESALPVEHLFSITATLGKASLVGAGPAGNRVIVPVTGGTFAGPKMRGTIVENSGGDWVVSRPDGTAKLDVRITLATDDSAIIYMWYSGLLVPKDGSRLLRTAPYFETADERYAWLNNVQGVATGESKPGAVTYEVYALSM